MDGQSCQGCFCALVALKIPESVIAWHTAGGPGNGRPLPLVFELCSLASLPYIVLFEGISHA